MNDINIMETFINFIESRKRQIDAIHSIMTTLHYEKGISPEDILNMETSELQDLIKDMRPTENWSMPRFIAMLKSYAAGTFKV